VENLVFSSKLGGENGKKTDGENGISLEEIYDINYPNSKLFSMLDHTGPCIIQILTKTNWPSSLI